MSASVHRVDLGVRWEPNAPGACLVMQDDGRARLELRAHADDPDQRSVVLAWSGCQSARMETANDEAIWNHPLYPLGLSDILWAGQVLDSPLVAELTDRNNAHPLHVSGRHTVLRHWIVPMKEVVVEVVAEQLAVERAPAALEGSSG